MMGVVLLVMSSVVELPESLASAMSGADGAAGPVVSTVITRAVVEASLGLPAASVATAVRL